MKPVTAYLLTAGALGLLIYTFRKMTMKFLKPVDAAVTSKFGDRTNPITKAKEFHNGIDLAVKDGTDIKAPADAVVKTVFQNDKGGLQIILEHKNNFRTGYAHLSSSIYPIGTKIGAGVVFAKSGRSGQATGAQGDPARPGLPRLRHRQGRPPHPMIRGYIRADSTRRRPFVKARLTIPSQRIAGDVHFLVE